MKARLIAYDFEQHGTRIKGRVLCVEGTVGELLVATMNEMFGAGSHWIEERPKSAQAPGGKVKSQAIAKR